MRKTLIALAGLALAAAPLSAAHAISDYSVAVTIPTQQLDLGKSVPIKGHVTGVSSKGFTVDIHASYSTGGPGQPIHIGHADVHSSGNFNKTYTPPKGGVYTFTVTVDDKNGSPVTDGGAGPLYVMRWTALQNMNLSILDQPSTSAGKTTGKKVAGVKWAHELFVKSNAHLYFTYYGVKCTQIQSYAGVSDTAPAHSEAIYSVVQTGFNVRTADVLSRAKAKHFTRDLDPEKNVIDVSAEFAEATGASGEKVIFGEPKAYCSVG